MELYICYQANCALRGFYICKCKDPQIYVCENHKSSHASHNPTIIPNTYYSDGRMSTTKIEDVLFTTQQYLCTSSTVQFGLFKYELVEIRLPEDYKESIKKLISHLTNQIQNTQRGKDDQIKLNVSQFFASLPKISMNYSYKLEKEASAIMRYYDSMYSRIADDATDFFNQTIDELISNGFLKADSRTLGIVTDTLEGQRKKLWDQIIIGNYSNESILEKFKSNFKKFSTKEVEFENITTKIKQDLETREDKIRSSIKEEIFSYLNEKIINGSYLQFIFYQSIGIPNLKTQIYKPEWFAIENKLLKNEPVSISNIIQTDIGVYSFLLTFEDSEKSILTELRDSKLTYIITFNNSKLLLLPGSNLEKLVIIQNYPRKIFSFQICEGEAVNDESQTLVSSTDSMLISAAYISWEDSIILLTSSNTLVHKSFNQSDEKYKLINLSIDKNEIIQDVNVKTLKKMILVRTSKSFIILNSLFEEVYRVRARGRRIELFDEIGSNSIFLYSLIGKVIHSCELVISLQHQSEIFKFTHNQESMLKKTISNIGKIFRKSIFEKDEDNYLKQFNLHFAPMPISNINKISIECRPEDILDIQPIKQSNDINNEEPEINNPSLKLEKLHEPSSQNLQINEKIRLNPFLFDGNRPTYDTIQGKCKLCGKACSLDGFICIDEHPCQSLCFKKGACCKFGKNLCSKKYPSGKDSHEGDHECDSGFHSCGEPCPVESCSVYCSRKYNHSKLHKCELHFSRNGKSCNNECFDNNHVHYVKCICADEEEAARFKTRKHCPGLSKDSIGCEEFWEMNHWEKFVC